MLGTIAFLGALTLASTSAPPGYHFSQRIPKAEDVSRLSGNVLPTNYAVQISLAEDFATTLKFSGLVTITMDVQTQISSEYLFHAKDLTILDTVLKKGTAVINATFAEADPKTDLVLMTPSVPLDPGSYTLQITYDGIINTKTMVGIYLSSYIDPFNQKKYVVATQFEDIHARKAFPSMDEPEMKAPFTLTLKYPVGYRSWSNTAAGTPSNADNIETIRFGRTQLMSTYLLAFVIADFNCKNADPTANGKTVELCSRIRAYDQTAKLALDAAPQLLDYMSSYVSSDYILPKMTLAAIPDFAPGAMENWGLVTFREADLLWDENESSNSNKQRVVTVLAHELSHQWFGDLVTISWWSDLFLNEGFATFFQYHAADSLYPDWELPKQFVVEQLQDALLSDSFDDVLPLSFDATDPDYSSRTNDVSYNKGGSILRMVRNFMGEDNFKLGLADYIQNNNLGNVNAETLWTSLDPYIQNLPENEQPPETLTTIMDSWTTKPGYPILTVKADGDDIVITQAQFVLSGDVPDTQWYVPITYTTSSDSTGFQEVSTQQWLTPGQTLTLSGVLKGVDWVVLNNQQTGYYRVHYDDNLLSKISKSLTSKVRDIDEISKSQIVDDLFNLAKVDVRSFSELITFLEFLKNDYSYYTWYSAFNGFDYLFKRTANEDVQKALRSYVKGLMKILLDSFPDRIDPNDQMTALRYALTMSWQCRLGDDVCLGLAQQTFSAYKLAPDTQLDPNLKGTIFCTALRTTKIAGGDFNFLYGKYLETEIASEKVTILKALGCVNDPMTRQHYLSMVLTGDEIRAQDITYVFSSVYSNSAEGVTEVVDFITDNYKQIVERFESVGTLNSLISSVVDYVNTQNQIDKLKKFSEVKDLDDSTKDAVTRALTTAAQNKDISKKLEDEFRSDFNIRTSDSVSSFHFANTICILAGFFLIYFY